LNLKNQYDFDYEAYEDQFDPLRTDRQARRKRKTKAHHAPKKSCAQIVTELADVSAGEASSFQTTYQPSRYEAGWLMESLREFYRQEYITDVLAQIRGGKEASVYRCAARGDLETDFLAAKVYRPRQFRQLRNDKVYREGRDVLTASGNALGPRDHRTWRALAKKTRYGAEVEHTSWLMHEFNTLKLLYEAGAAVPKPYSASANAILMSYVGGADVAAPTLNTVRLSRGEAEPLFEETLRNIELMLTHGFIHGDLSAYNILYWEGKITLIDFPQVTDSRFNPQAQFILGRDIERVCQYFASAGIKRDPKAILNRLWKYHIEDNRDVQADLSRREVDENL
jgi:RIO kinase 1